MTGELPAQFDNLIERICLAGAYIQGFPGRAQFDQSSVDGSHCAYIAKFAPHIKISQFDNGLFLSEVVNDFRDQSFAMCSIASLLTA